MCWNNFMIQKKKLKTLIINKLYTKKCCLIVSSVEKIHKVKILKL